jgi:hypothetical protein
VLAFLENLREAGMHNSYFDRILTSTDPLTERDLHTTRRNIILPLLGALSAVLPAAGAHAGAIDSSETQSGSSECHQVGPVDQRISAA